MSREKYDLNSISKIFDLTHQNEIAFVNKYKGVSISYSQVFKDVEKQLVIIKEYGPEKGKKILLFLDSGYQFVIGLFAIIVSGNIPVLVNTKLKEELKSIDEQCDFILSNENYFQYLSNYFNLHHNRLIQTFEEAQVESTRDNLSKINFLSHDTMLILFTSGSTGQPKWVEKTFENILLELDFLAELLSMSQGELVLPLVPAFHIYGILYCVFLPLYVGATIQLDIPFSPMGIYEDGIKQGANYLVGNPSLYSALKPFLGNEKEEDQLKYLISSTMPLDTDLIEDFFNKKNWRIIEFYGSTETGGIAYRKFYKNHSWKFFPYVQYQNNSKDSILTICSPCITPQKEKWYSTGDVVELHENSEFQLLGRVNQLVKIAGNRVSTLEVEKILKQHNHVIDAAVIGDKGKGLSGEELIAFICLNGNKDLTIKELKKYCSKKLAEFKIPKHFCFVEKIPRGENSKILYGKLKEWIE